MSLKNHPDGSGQERLRIHKKQKRLQRNFLATIELSKKLTPTKKTNRLLKIYELCKERVGPNSLAKDDSIELLNKAVLKNFVPSVNHRTKNLSAKTAER